MERINIIGKYDVCRLDEKTASTHAKSIARLANLIPLVDYSEFNILAESKEGRIFHGKWDHSLIVFDQDRPIAVIVGYERDKEDNYQYPENSIHVGLLAVDENYRRQGIAHELVGQFLDCNKSLLHLKGKPIYSIQTNSADWNQHVIDLYRSFGFRQIATKNYDNRIDVVLFKQWH